MKLTIQEIISIILFICLLLWGVIDRIIIVKNIEILKKEIAFSKQLDEFKAWQVQATGIINNLANQHKPEVKK